MLPVRTSPRFFNEEGYECLIVLTRSPVDHQRLSLRTVHFLAAEKPCTEPHMASALACFMKRRPSLSRHPALLQPCAVYPPGPPDAERTPRRLCSVAVLFELKQAWHIYLPALGASLDLFTR